MKKTIIIYPASIQTHVIPAMDLADHLCNEYEIYVLVANRALADIVSSRGYVPILVAPYKVGNGREVEYLLEKERKITLWNIIRSMLNNELYHDKLSEWRFTLGGLWPVAVIVDIFNSTELFALSTVFPQAALICFNPMLSTYRKHGFPTVSERSWANGETKKDDLRQNGQPFQGLKSWPGVLFRAVYACQIKRLLKYSKLHEKNRIAENSTYVMLLDKIPEVLLAPLELELSPTVKQPSQLYLELCINENRKDLGLDESFLAKFQRILVKRAGGSKVIYCSFGTFYEDSNPKVLQFLNVILNVAESFTMPVEFIFSVKPGISKTLLHKRRVASNIHFFSKVPQLKVLANTDLHITHGGLGSIKESIHYEVPMLVYPLDLVYDQNGNGLKVEHHGLGMRGVFNQEKPEMIREKIVEILKSGSFRDRVSRFNEDMKCRYPEGIVSDTIKALVRRNGS